MFCLSAGSDYHFHRRNADYAAVAAGVRRWSDKNGGDYTRCCWDDPALQDFDDAGANGIPPDAFDELSSGGVIAVVIAANPCTPHDNYLYSQLVHLMQPRYGGVSPHNCA